ncbi:MAG: DUF58 domain-containing protein [Candidatus Mcinerneyibacterium aminivorans]|uniref:DUF58 domain-containing protein n=1 Tax=Candidatus Mcinerneyibacterium aminivorans TaxID=2703815 RepID=A0A5D0MKK2_9BACT|nr:MAG: DUF58 domain-containing protein [Candidatus Mcinerneyibacterium aminivorans]
MKEIIKKVKHIELKTKRLVDEVFSGEYHSIFKGQGVEFSEVRPYQYGDDVRRIDWRVTAKHGKPYVKLFKETRQLNILLVFDGSPSTLFSAKANKREIAGEIASILTFSALKNSDKTGLVLFSDGVDKYIPLEKGKKHSLNIIQHILTFESRAEETDLTDTIRKVLHYLNRRSIIFIISDFYTDGYQKELKMLSKKHDVIGIRLIEPLEKRLDEMGVIPIKDSESDKIKFINSKKAKKDYRESFQKKDEQIKAVFRNAKADLLNIDIADNYFHQLLKFFKMRERRFR